MNDNVRNWINKAEEDAITSQILLGNNEYIPTASVCFHCQQMAEKYLKAYLTAKEVYFKRTHDLPDLLDNYLLTFDSEFELLRDACMYLTDFGVLPRYPGDYPELTVDVAREAWRFANQIKNFIEPKLM